jgi:uncharacterized small protein (DUF1192 family)
VPGADPLQVDERLWSLRLLGRRDTCCGFNAIVDGPLVAPAHPVLVVPASVVAARDEEIARLRKLISDTDGETADAIEEREEAREEVEELEAQVAALTEEVERLGRELGDYKLACGNACEALDSERAEVARLRARVEDHAGALKTALNTNDALRGGLAKLHAECYWLKAGWRADMDAQHEQMDAARAEGARQERKRLRDWMETTMCRAPVATWAEFAAVLSSEEEPNA